MSHESAGVWVHKASPVHRAKDERVDWLYSGPGTVNREEYLLGKRIDKLVDPTVAEEEREEQVA